jgi:hypothetical protein
MTTMTEQEAKRAAAVAWAERHYRNVEEFTANDLQIVIATWEAATATIQPVAAQEPVGCPDFSDDMLTQDEMRRHIRLRLQERCAHDYRTSANFGGALCSKCGMVEPAPTAAPAQAATEAVREAIAKAYGYLWHVNASMDAPAGVVLTSMTPEQAAYKARKTLRELLTHEQRGKAINSVREELCPSTTTPAATPADSQKGEGDE